MILLPVCVYMKLTCTYWGLLTWNEEHRLAGISPNSSPSAGMLSLPSGIPTTVSGSAGKLPLMGLSHSLSWLTQVGQTSSSRPAPPGLSLNLNHTPNSFLGMVLIPSHLTAHQIFKENNCMPLNFSSSDQSLAVIFLTQRSSQGWRNCPWR